MSVWGIRNDGGGRFVLMECRPVLGDDECLWRDVATAADWPTASRLVRLLRAADHTERNDER